MKLISCFFVISILIFGNSILAQEDWENPAITERNKLQLHVTFVPYQTLEQALNLQQEESPFFKLLNGNWKFHWAENPNCRPETNGCWR